MQYLPALKINAQKLVDATAKDKKHLGNVRRFVLPVGIGDATVVEDVTEGELLNAAGYMLALAKPLPEREDAAQDLVKEEAS